MFIAQTDTVFSTKEAADDINSFKEFQVYMYLDLKRL